MNDKKSSQKESISFGSKDIKKKYIIMIFIMLSLHIYSNCYCATYPIHKNITSTVFWIGENSSPNNGFINNVVSSWDENWMLHYGEVDSPDNRTGYLPANFIPTENPFYVALPYNDFNSEGERKISANNNIYWANEKSWGKQESMCKNRWVKITKDNISVYAQWEDVGPFKSDNVNYVFGTEEPENSINNYAGIDVSPAVRDYLGLKDIDKVTWQFVDENNIPEGEWKKLETFYNGDNVSLNFEKSNNKLYEEIQLTLSKNWNLAGSNCKISSIQTFLTNSINTVWKWTNGKWEIFSSNLNILALIKKYKINTLYFIYPFEGFWVNAKNNAQVEICKNIFWYKPSVITSWYWQLTGQLKTDINAVLYDVDLFETDKSTIDKLKKKGKKIICYFNAGAFENWRDDAYSFPDSAIGNKMDNWEGEKWIDIRNEKIKNIMMLRLELAEKKGCDGVEPDNIDGYNKNTGFELTYNDQLKYNMFLSYEAHKRGLAIGLKNDLGQVEDLLYYFDFSINEQCHEFEECEKLMLFIKQGKPVFNAEYAKKYFTDESERTKLCNDAKKRKFKTLILPLALDGSKFYSCN